MSIKDKILAIMAKHKTLTAEDFIAELPDEKPGSIRLSLTYLVRANVLKFEPCMMVYSMRKGKHNGTK